MTQQALARKAGISTLYLSRLERGTQDPRFSVAVKLARALKVSLDDLAK